MRATLGLSAGALSSFHLIDCLRGSSPSYDLWERKEMAREGFLPSNQRWDGEEY